MSYMSGAVWGAFFGGLIGLGFGKPWWAEPVSALTGAAIGMFCAYLDGRPA